MSIAPTGSISNIVKGMQVGEKNYIGVSGGVEPIFALYYTRRTESFSKNEFYKVFHSSVQAYIDKMELKVLSSNFVDEERDFASSSIGFSAKVSSFVLVFFLSILYKWLRI